MLRGTTSAPARGALRFGPLALLLLLLGCQAPLAAPPAFVELRDRGEGFRATTADDARLWVRSLYEPTPADVDFWVGRLRNDLLERGYRLVEEGQVADRAGRDGRWLEFAGNVSGQRVGYLVAIWPRSPFWLWFWDRGNWLQVVEFAAPQAVFAAHSAAVRESLRTVRW